jgi:hypothetical protein
LKGDRFHEMTMLQRGDSVPHFEVQTQQGEVFRYSAIWQRKNLVLLTLPETAAADAYVRDLTAREAEFLERDTVCVVTREGVAGLPTPGALVADRWGEIVEIRAANEIADLPRPEGLLEWVEYIENRCPECEGEAK